MKRSIFAIMLVGLVMLVGLGFAVLSISRPAPVDVHAMTAANQLVAAGHYAEAVHLYDQLIVQGVQDAALYYNLGNAALSLGDASRAVAAYEEAAALAPRDADIRANLALARQQARSQDNMPSTHVLGGLADVTSRWLTVDELALLALGAWLTLGLMVFAYLWLQPERRTAVLRVAVAMVSLVVLTTAGMLVSRMTTPQLAVPATMMGQQAEVSTDISDSL